MAYVWLLRVGSAILNADRAIGKIARSIDGFLAARLIQNTGKTRALPGVQPVWHDNRRSLRSECCHAQNDASVKTMVINPCPWRVYPYCLPFGLTDLWRFCSPQPGLSTDFGTSKFARQNSINEKGFFGTALFYNDTSLVQISSFYRCRPCAF